MNDLDKYYSLFKAYVEQFYCDDEEIHTNIKLKEAHTFRVCNIAKELVESLGLPEHEENTALLCALFHDLGRFQQFTQFRTFRDHDSINHANLAVDILKNKNWLQDLSTIVQASIFSAIYYHNVSQVPNDLHNNALLHSKILRDADKLDIYYVVTEYYKDPIKNKYQAVGNHLKQEHGFSPKIYDYFMNREKISYGDIRTMDDLILLQLGWIYDLNFSFSVDYLYQKNYLSILLSTLPSNEKTDLLNQKISNFFAEQR